MFKMTGLLICLLPTTYATLIWKETFLELVHTYFKDKIVFLPLPAADFCSFISFPGIQLIHMQSKKILLLQHVAFTDTITKINFYYFLSNFFIPFKITSTLLIDLTLYYSEFTLKLLASKEVRK